MINRKWLRLSVLACIGCCAMPFIVGATSGIAAIIAISADFWICAGVLLLGAAVWLVMQHRRTRCVNTGNEACPTDCSCKQSG